MRTIRFAIPVLAAAGLLAGCNLANPGTQAPARVQSEPSAIGTWQLVPTADGGVWKLNTVTGETRRCLDGMLEKACVLANDVDSVAQLKENTEAPPVEAGAAPTVPEALPTDAAAPAAGGVAPNG